MSVELHADNGAARPMSALEAVLAAAPAPVERRRPNVSGDLATVFEAAPLFRRTVVGYDRFQVDSYVQWAEDELATADREREHLVTRLLGAQADLAEARQLLAHSSSGGEFLQLSRRIGSMLAAAADEAESLHADAEADRTAASAEAKRLIANAECLLADTEAEAEKLIAEAAGELEAALVESRRILDEAEHERLAARAEVEARRVEARAVELRARAQADSIREQAAAEALAVRLRARDEIVRMLDTGREQRRRADAAAEAARERLDRDAVARRACLLAEVEALEHRRSALRAEIELLAGRAAGSPDRRLAAAVRRLLGRLHWRSRSLRIP